MLFHRCFFFDLRTSPALMSPDILHSTFRIISSCLVPVLPEQPHAFYVIADAHPHMRRELPRG